MRMVWGRRHQQLSAAERLQSVLLAQVHGDAVMRAEHHTVSIGTGEWRLPRAGFVLCWMGMSHSWLGFPLQGVDLGASALVAMRVRHGPCSSAAWEERGGQGAASLG